MKPLLDRLGLKFLFRFDPETAHSISVRALSTGMVRPGIAAADDRLRVKVAGLDFPNPLGIAAGYDKNAEIPDALLGLGFGFAEIGTITPRRQRGNPKPRIFRLIQDQGVINRLGFNNDGHAAAFARLSARKSRPGIVGVNIGANKDSEDRIADFEAGVRLFAPVASYLTINISSPNTPGLRTMQSGEVLGELLSRVLVARDAALAGGNKATPAFLKIAPDLSEAEIEAIAQEARRQNIDGIIVSNTTLARNGLRSGNATETGGLSGKPLFERSTIALAKMRRCVGPDMALIGVGGVDSAETALDKIRAGADLVQLYTGMIYAGPSLPAKIVHDTRRFAERERLGSISDLRDSDVSSWADRRLD